jgi:membrane fusion protein, multidrug efflux system
MASKTIYTLVAAIGIAAASGAAWWYQNNPKAAAALLGEKTASAPANAGAPGPAAGASGPAGPRAPAVEVAKVEVMKLTDDTQAVGNLRSRQSVMLRPEVSGRITQLNFRDGDRVQKGQLLVQFDDQLPVAQTKQSQAELSIAVANHKRNQDLAAQNFISQRTVDESAASLEVAQAKLALSRATAARLAILAPFNGITGIRTVNPGDYLKDGADIVNIEDMDAVFVDFRLPERFLTKIKKGQRADVDLDALPGRKFVAFVQAIDPLIDANGRSVSVRACIDNRSLSLRPGMFARVTAVFGERARALVIPEEAIVPQGPRLFVIKVVDGPEKDSKISERVEVKVGIRRPGRVEITEGLSEGDVIVIAGQQRIQKDGSAVRVMQLGRPGGGGAPPPAAAASPAGQAGAQAGKANAVKLPPGKAMPTPQPDGPNPCLADAMPGESPGTARPSGKV